MSSSKDNPLTHFDRDGNARMVDVSAKSSTQRIAVASGCIDMLPQTARLIRSSQIAKGDVLGVARLAAIMAAKRTDQIIPLCHSLPIQSIDVEFSFVDEHRLQILATIKTTGTTGVEMEALHAVSVGLLTVYDMCKAADRAMTIGNIQLESKSGGKSGDWNRGCDVNP